MKMTKKQKQIRETTEANEEGLTTKLCFDGGVCISTGLRARDKNFKIGGCFPHVEVETREVVAEGELYGYRTRAIGMTKRDKKDYHCTEAIIYSAETSKKAPISFVKMHFEVVNSLKEQYLFQYPHFDGRDNS